MKLGLVYRGFIQNVVLMLGLIILAVPALADAEAEARDLLGQVQQAIESSDPAAALPILDHLEFNFSGTQAASRFAYKRAQVYERLGNYKQAREIAASTLRRNPQSIAACYAQCVLGTCSAMSGDVARGVKELLAVEDMLGGGGEYGPMGEAIARLRGICDKCVAEDIDVVSALGATHEAANKKRLVDAMLSELDNARLEYAQKALWDQKTRLKARNILLGLMNSSHFDQATVVYHLAYTYYTDYNYSVALMTFDSLYRMPDAGIFAVSGKFMTGDCHERLGDYLRARKAFEDVITEFGDHKLADVARSRLTSLATRIAEKQELISSDVTRGGTAR